jgi:hypothetical protein
MVKNWKVKDLLKVENQVIVREILKDLGRDEVIRGINGPPLGWGTLRYYNFIVLQAFIAGIIRQSDVIDNLNYVGIINDYNKVIQIYVKHIKGLPDDITDMVAEYRFSSKKPKKRSRKLRKRSKKSSRRSRSR